MDTPPPIPPRPPGYETRPGSTSTVSPALPPRRSTQSGGAGPPPPPPPPPQTSWTHLFYSDGTPTPLYESLMEAFWDALDPHRTGGMPPEVLSNFLTVQRFPPEEDIWKIQHKSIAAPFRPVDNADWEFRACLDAWFFEYRVVERGPPGFPQLPGGGMPLLTKGGFIAFMAVMHGAMPERAARCINAAMRHYGVWLHMGPVPDAVLPATCPPEMKRRMDMAGIRARNAAEEKIAAARANSELQRQGREAALDLLGPSYVYRYI